MSAGAYGHRRQLLAQSFAAVSHTGDTVETVLATIPFPPMGPNDRIDVDWMMTASVNANIKRTRVRFTNAAGDLVGATALVGDNVARANVQIGNVGATNVQKSSPVASGSSGSAVFAGATETAGGGVLVITGVCIDSAADTVTLECYTAELVRG